MKVVNTSAELRGLVSQQKRIAFVPTMGNLHAGHLHLVDIAKQHADCVVVSIFVNPMQFGPGEDLDTYPRTLDEDCKKLEATGATIVFAPSVMEMYPGYNGVSLNQTMLITPPPIATALCGASRPGHFEGVLTVVAKLLNLVQPNVAVFGKKDFQQLFLIKKLINQFNIPVEVIAGDIVREDGGLALSSRNNKLSTAEKVQAMQLNLHLKEVIQAINSHPTNLTAKDIASIEEKTAKSLTDKGWQVDYISVRSTETLKPALSGQGNLIVLGAAALNKTRLIDNIEFCAKPLN
jgi:pantoate--beta-alanine ligase